MKPIYKDLRYDTIRVLIASGHIKYFKDIFEFIPKTVVYRDLGVNFNRFVRAIFNPTKFRLEELIKLSEMFEVDPRKMIELAYTQSLSRKKKAKSN